MARERCPAYDDVLPAEEFDRQLAIMLAALDGDEGERIRELITWFRRRYPTVADRLRYARRKHAEWTATSGIALEKQKPSRR